MPPVHPGVLPQLNQVTAQMNQLHISHPAAPAASLPVNMSSSFDSGVDSLPVTPRSLRQSEIETSLNGGVMETAGVFARQGFVEGRGVEDNVPRNSAVQELIHKAPYVVLDTLRGAVVAPTPQVSTPLLRYSSSCPTAVHAEASVLPPDRSFMSVSNANPSEDGPLALYPARIICPPAGQACGMGCCPVVPLVCGCGSGGIMVNAASPCPCQPNW